MPFPERFVPSISHVCANSSWAAGPILRRMPTPELRLNGRPRVLGIISPVPTSTSSVPASALKLTYMHPQTTTLDGPVRCTGTAPAAQPPIGFHDSPRSEENHTPPLAVAT